jgi:hypothetical protein
MAELFVYTNMALEDLSAYTGASGQLVYTGESGSSIVRFDSQELLEGLELDDTLRFIGHEYHDLFGDIKVSIAYLDPTWSIMDSEPGMDDLAEGADEILGKMGKDLEIYPFQDANGDRLFLARFEFPNYGEDMQFSEAGEGPFIDFLGGFPIDCIEMLVAIGEISSKAKEGGDSKVSVQPGRIEGAGSPTPPLPQSFFEWPEEDKILLNVTALPEDGVEILADGLGGEPEPQNVHWWLRVQIYKGIGGEQFPVPGEFLGLGVRMMPGTYWGDQKSSPFVYSGNWMDTVYYTNALITEIIEPDDSFPFPRYTVQWRKFEIEVYSSDFAEYQIDDRVTILKDVATDKTSQLWKDDDMKEFGETWMIAPVAFYGLENPEGE